MPIPTQEIISAFSRLTKMEDITKKVGEGECVLFLGAGVHYDSAEYNYPKEKRPLLGGELSEKLADECDFLTRFPKESKQNLQRVAMCYEIEHERSKLVEEVKKHVQTQKIPSPVLKALAELPFSLIVTTNYDNLLERSLIEKGKNPVPIIYDKSGRKQTANLPTPSEDEPLVLKIHGDLSEPESLVITDEDYIQFILRMSGKGDFYPVPQTFLYHFQLWPTLFVGYSLLDYNLRLLFKTLRWKLDKATFKKGYSVDPYPDPLIFDMWYLQRKYVTFITQSVWAFVPDLYKNLKGIEMPKG